MAVKPKNGANCTVIGTEEEVGLRQQEEEGGMKIDDVQEITTAIDAEAMINKSEEGAAAAQVSSLSNSNAATIDQARKKENKHKEGKEEEEQVELETPYVFLLSPSALLPASDLRLMRKCLGRGNFFILQKGPGPKTSSSGYEQRPCSDWDFNFNFELEDDVRAFQSTPFHHHRQTRPSSSLDDDCPPPPSLRHSYTICFNSEFQTCDGFIAPRTFHYLLAIACGLPIVDFSFIRAATTGVKKGYLYVPDLGDASMAGKQMDQRRGRGRGKKKEVMESMSLVVGDVESGSWTGPAQAKEVVRERLRDLSSKKPIDPAVAFHNGLLEGFTILLCGTYDTIPVSPISGRGRKRARSSSNAVVASASGGGDDREDGSYPRLYSRGRLLLLLTLCGARVLELEKYAKDSSTIRIKCFCNRTYNEFLQKHHIKKNYIFRNI